eukprot:11228658-Ditylum_brightwellii.AAC.1
MIKGHVVVEDLIANNVKLLPATIDPFIAEGPDAAPTELQHAPTRLWSGAGHSGRHRNVPLDYEGQ